MDAVWLADNCRQIGIVSWLAVTWRYMALHGRYMRTRARSPRNASQARPLAKLPAAQQPAAWEKAQAKAKDEGKPVAARHVEAAVAEV